jgi:lambda repressor-like predicted transcriptional regulator
MASGKRPRTKEWYNIMLAALRETGGNFAQARKRTGVDRATLRRVWEHGWPNVEGCLPVKDVLQMDRLMVRAARAGADPEEQVAVAQQVLTNSLQAAREDAHDAASMLANASKRAQEAEAKANAMLDDAVKRLAEVEELARSKVSDAEKAAAATIASADIQAKQRLAELLQRAKVDAAETMADEANAAKFGRKAALGAAAIAALVLKDAQVLATQLRAALGDLSKLTPVQAIRVAREMVKLVESAEKAVILALQAERLRIGQPTEVIGIQSVDGGLEEKEIKLKAVQRALERAKAKGMTLVQGGSDAAAGGAVVSAVAASGAGKA